MGSRGKYIWNSPGHPWLSSQEIPLGSEAAQACQELKGSSAWNRSSSLSNRSFSWGASALGALPRAHLLPEVMETAATGLLHTSIPTWSPTAAPAHPVELWAPSAPDKSHSVGPGKLPEASQSFPAPSKPISSSIPVRGALDQSRRIFIPRN